MIFKENSGKIEEEEEEDFKIELKALKILKSQTAIKFQLKHLFTNFINLISKFHLIFCYFSSFDFF